MFSEIVFAGANPGVAGVVVAGAVTVGVTSGEVTAVGIGLGNEVRVTVGCVVIVCVSVTCMPPIGAGELGLANRAMVVDANTIMSTLVIIAIINTR